MHQDKKSERNSNNEILEPGKQRDKWSLIEQNGENSLNLIYTNSGYPLQKGKKEDWKHDWLKAHLWNSETLTTSPPPVTGPNIPSAPVEDRRLVPWRQ